VKEEAEEEDRKERGKKEGAEGHMCKRNRCSQPSGRPDERTTQKGNEAERKPKSDNSQSSKGRDRNLNRETAKKDDKHKWRDDIYMCV
jgi:hypothetical protein